MIAIACFVALAAAAAAESPQSREWEAPYPAAQLPARQELRPPATAYGVPADSYAAPQAEYSGSARAAAPDTETLEADGAGARGGGQVEGAYYVLVPGGRLQRVQFRADSDARAMAYSARLTYSAADQAPLYVYTRAAAASAAPAAAYVQLF